MSDSFKHITLTPAEDDEVIIAGAPEKSHAMAQPEAEPPAQTQPTPDPAPDPAPKPTRKQPQKPSSRSNTYHETTLEDLDAPKMPTAQRVVIIAAIVCIIGALVYYFVAMR